ncbi:kinase-like domain-containing protein [Chaetomium sp. MPI-SDFR-AT-0129]|nr:kinase-like domain-containing protein [Chaetomium sp. MPI-SDFR-AT-0129]
MPHNSPFFCPAPDRVDDDSEREWSQTPEPDEDEKPTPRANLAGLQLRYDHRRKLRSGFALGTSEGCDICLPKTSKVKGISGFQCLICFDAHDRLVLKDVRDVNTSTGKRADGTAVSYNGKGREKRRGFTWLLSGTDFTDRADGRQETLIYLHDNICFRAVVPPRDHSSEEYRARVAQFRQGVTVDSHELPLTGLGLDGGESTAGLDTGAQTPRQGAVWIKRRTLGQGSFAAVTLFSNVSTGVGYARKQPAAGKDYDLEEWRKEARLLRRISHGLAALAYLHELDPPIIHRDIKPANILVQHRTPRHIHIKLTDFGLSRDGHELRTQCGTELYLAPEIQANAAASHRAQRKPYTSAVDIWSLGVMVYEFGFGLPDPLSAEGIAWCEAIVDKLGVDEDESGLADFLANEMLVIEVPDRSTAKACRQAALDAGLASSALQPATDDGTNRGTCGNPGAVPADGRSSSLSSLAAETERHHRSGAPEPSMATQAG